MTLQSMIFRLFAQEDINFLVTNRIPRRLATRFVGWFSKIEQPLIRDLSIGAWRLFSGLDLTEAKQSRFRSMHDCFTRELKDGARPVDPDPNVLTSPCDAIVGACGAVEGTRLYQIKGFPYALDDLLGDPALVAAHRNARYVTLRLTSSMYHRVHAPYDCHVDRVTYVSGDTWNVNPIALKRIESLFCKNERAILTTTLAHVPAKWTPVRRQEHAPNRESGAWTDSEGTGDAPGDRVTIVLVAAVLVASIRLHFLDVLLNLRHRGPNVMACDAHLRKGQEMGWFEHGSTAIVFAPEHYSLCVAEGAAIRMGEPLMRREADTALR